MGKIHLVYVLFGISPRIWNGLRTYTEVPLYKDPVRTSQETHYVTATKPNRLMLFRETVAVFMRTIRNTQIYSVR
jgi:hypothetical protein